MKSKILIVDDEPDNLEYMARVLEKMTDECEIFQSNDGLMAYGVIEKSRPDLVITDWQMPNNGIDLIKRMRNNSDYLDIPVIVYSGFMASSENVVMALEAGATDYVNKPIRPLELIARSHVLLRLNQDQNESQNYNGTNKIVHYFLKSELKETYEHLKMLIPQISNKNTEFEGLKEDLDRSVDQVINNSESVILRLKKFLLTHTAEEIPSKESYEINDTVAEVMQNFSNLISKKGLHIINKFPASKGVIANRDVAFFMLWYLLKESMHTIEDGGKINIKEGKVKDKNKVAITFSMAYRAFPKEIMEKVNINDIVDDAHYLDQNNKCVRMLQNLKLLALQNDGVLEITASKWKGIRLTMAFPISTNS